MKRFSIFRTVLFLLPWLVATSDVQLRAQPQTGLLGGDVVDSSGAVVPGAWVEISGPDNFQAKVQSDAQGRYLFSGLAPGDYRVQVEVAGFDRYENARLRVSGGRTATLRVKLAISSVKTEVTVGDQGQVDVDPSASAGTVVVAGENLKALSNNRDDLAEDLQALAGPSIGPGGGEIFVDGFSGGKLPSKASIREIRVNSNPFSAEYDRLGFGRVEIFTKPGADTYRAEAGFNFSDASFNSRNPFAVDKPPYQRKMLEGNLEGRSPSARRSTWRWNASAFRR